MKWWEYLLLLCFTIVVLLAWTDLGVWVESWGK